MTIENIRLQAVERFINLDLENDKELLEIVELASSVTGSPFALITFLDKKTQYLKVRKGVSEETMPREISFCSYAIKQNKLMVVPDALKDERFIHNPIVAGNPGVRFYAGMPLTTFDGQKVGTLCVLDLKEHDLSEHQQTMLKILGNQVIKIIELRIGKELLEKNQKELQEQRQINDDANIRLRSFFESSTNFHVLLGKHGEVIDYNKTAYNFIKTVHKCELQRGDRFEKYLHPEFVSTFIKQYNLCLKGEKSAKEGSTDYGELGIIWWEASFEAARDKEDQIIGVSYLIRNVTERKLKEQKIVAQNQSLLKIAHIQAHDFRAPLTSIMGLMDLIKEENYAPPKEYIQMLEEAVYILDGKIRQVITNVDDSVVNDLVAEIH